MKKYVIDASIVLKSLLSEDLTVAAKLEKILNEIKAGGAEILSHDLINIEVANGLRFTLKDKGVAIETYQKFLRLPLKIISLTKAQQEKTLDLSYDFHTTVYDTSYHILAKSHGAIFLTSDADYFKKAKTLKGVELW